MKKIDDLDEQIGARVRARRAALGWSQAELARRVGVTYQQIHKYEAGSNRVSASTLAKMSVVLGCELAALVSPALHTADEETDLQSLYRTASALPSEKLRLLLDVALTFRQAVAPGMTATMPDAAD